MTAAEPPGARALAAIEATGLAFMVTEHGPVGSLAEAAQARGLTPEQVLRTIVVRRAAEDYRFVLMPGGSRISWPKLRAVLGVSRASLPDAADALAVTGYRPGTITPFGAQHSWPVIADASIAAGPVSIGGGGPGVAFTVDSAALVEALGATVADVREPPPG